jgi:hypothetical protein
MRDAIKTLNGWQRLWIVIAATYAGILVLVLVFYPQHTPDKIKHDYRFYSQLSKKAQDAIQNTRVAWLKEDSFLKEAIGGKLTDGYVVSIPNGHSLIFRDSLAREEAEAASTEYWRRLETEVEATRLSHYLKWFAAWILPLAAIYLSGIAYVWVRAGFGSRRDFSQPKSD